MKFQGTTRSRGSTLIAICAGVCSILAAAPGAATISGQFLFEVLARMLAEPSEPISSQADGREPELHQEPRDEQDSSAGETATGDSETKATFESEIVVTAQRREQSMQDVPPWPSRS